MAKFLPGPSVGAVSGSIGGTVFSRNRYGAYTRNRAMVTRQTSNAAMNAKARLANISAAWRDETAATKLAWQTWALNNPITDALGQKQTLTGHAAYVGLNTRLHLAGQTLLTVPPIVAAPAPLTALTATWDIGAGDFELVFTPTPIGAAERLWISAAVVNSAGINYVENLMKFIKVSAAAQATDYDISADLALRFGTLTVGQKCVVDVCVLDEDTGLISTPMRVSGTIVSTP